MENNSLLFIFNPYSLIFPVKKPQIKIRNPEQSKNMPVWIISIILSKLSVRSAAIELTLFFRPETLPCYARILLCSSFAGFYEAQSENAWAE
jgi:hypothetical protein